MFVSCANFVGADDSCWMHVKVQGVLRYGRGVARGGPDVA
jgi:hypothetical protein